jgi:hypothetical protein
MNGFVRYGTHRGDFLERLIELSARATKRGCGVHVETCAEWRCAYIDPTVPAGRVLEDVR